MIIEIGLASIVSFLIGWNLSENHTRKQLKEYVKSKMNTEEPQVEKVQIRVEKVDNTLFAYRVDNGFFLGQSKSGKELVDILREVFDDKIVNVVIHTDDGAEYIKEFF